MGYLQPTDYENFGLASDTTDDWVTAASALMEAYCRRASLNRDPVCRADAPLSEGARPCGSAICHWWPFRRRLRRL